MWKEMWMAVRQRGWKNKSRQVLRVDWWKTIKQLLTYSGCGDGEEQSRTICHQLSGGEWECWDLLCWSPSGVTTLRAKWFTKGNPRVLTERSGQEKIVPRHELFLSHTPNSCGFHKLSPSCSDSPTAHDWHCKMQTRMWSCVGFVHKIFLEMDVHVKTSSEK